MKKLVLQILITIFGTLLIVPALCADDDMRVDFDEVKLNMSTNPESGWNFTDVDLYLKGNGLMNAKGYYAPVFTRAETESVSLLDKDDNQDEFGFRVMNETKTDESEYRLWERFDKLPARTDKYLYLEGYVEVYLNPDEDSVIEIDDYLEHSGKPVEHPLLKKHHVELTYLTKDDMIEFRKRQESQKDSQDSLVEAFGEVFKRMFGFSGNTDLTFLIKDSDKAVLMVELLDKNGTAMKTESHGRSKDSATGVMTYGVDYERMLPAQGKIMVYMNDGEGLVKVPFKFKVELP